MSMGILPLFMSVHHMSGWCLWKSEEGIGAPGTGVTGVAGFSVGPLPEQPVPFTEGL